MSRVNVRRFVVATGAAFLPIIACADPAPPAPATALSPSPSASPPVPHADTKAEGGDCKYFNYYHDESKNAGSPGACATECDCDGMRACTGGACQGDPRPAIDCDSPKHKWNEAWNPLGAGKCDGDCDCDGRRTCVWPPLKQRASAKSGLCEGVAR